MNNKDCHYVALGAILGNFDDAMLVFYETSEITIKLMRLLNNLSNLLTQIEDVMQNSITKSSQQLDQEKPP